MPLHAGAAFRPRPFHGRSDRAHAAAEDWLPFRRLVTTTPMIALAVTKRRGSGASRRFLDALGFGRSFVPGGGETSISRSPSRAIA